MVQKSSRDRKIRLGAVEVLEDRAVPATFGVPWSDPSHLTLSFVPDGTQIAGHSSSLFQTLNARQPAATWQRDVLRAFQTWAVNANINIGLVADGGQALGAAGLSQHDPRFGDIRVGGQAMAADALSISVPNDPAVSSTMTGDVLLNTSASFDGKTTDVFTVLLHEAGHVFGLGEVTDPNSPLYSKYLRTSKLTSGDVTALQAFYGHRAPDAHEGSNGNDTIATATTIQPSGGFTGAAPLVAYGDVTTLKDVDVYSFRAPSGYKGPVTIRLQSAGISLLAPRLTITDARGRALGDVQASSGLGDTLTVVLGSVDRNATYYVQVRGATSDVFGIGSYGVAVTFDAVNRVAPATLDAVLRGPYQSLSTNDVNSILLGVANPLLNNDRGADDSLNSATVLTSSPGYARNSHYETVGSIATLADVDYYRIATADAPANGKPLVLTVTGRALGVNGTAPRLTVVDRDGNPVPAQILTNGDGTFTVQAVGVKAGGWYLLKVGPETGAGSPATGNYSLSVQFGTAAAQLTNFAAGTLPSNGSGASGNLYVGESQLTHLVFSASAVGAVVPGSAVRMTVLDASGRLVSTLIAPVGDTVTGFDMFLTPGAYTVHFIGLGASGAAPPRLAYRLLGKSISDPIGPVLTDPTLAPAYTVPTLPGWFLFPGGVLTENPILFVPVVPPPPTSPGA